MRIVASLLATFVTSFLLSSAAHALSVEEIIRLKEAGVSDSTLELLIKRAGDARSAGVWKQDGWVVHSTESKFPDTPRLEDYHFIYNITANTEIYNRRHRRTR